MTEPVDWSLPIQTVDGQPAKLVYTRSGYGDNYLVVIGHSPNEQAQWTNEEGGSFGKYFIRNVPEPPVRLEGWIGLWAHLDVDGDRRTSMAYAYRDEILPAYAYVLNLALVSEKCPESIERVK